MFEMLSYYQGKLIFCVIIWLIVCCVSCYDTNKGVEEINDRNSSDYRKERLRTAPTFGLIVAIVVLIIALVLPLSLNE